MNLILVSLLFMVAVAVPVLFLVTLVLIDRHTARSDWGEG